MIPWKYVYGKYIFFQRVESRTCIVGNHMSWLCILAIIHVCIMIVIGWVLVMWKKFYPSISNQKSSDFWNWFSPKTTLIIFPFEESHYLFKFSPKLFLYPVLAMVNEVWTDQTNCKFDKMIFLRITRTNHDFQIRSIDGALIALCNHFIIMVNEIFIFCV